MIPQFEQFIYPFLKVLEDGKIRTKKEMDDLLAGYLNISDSDRTERTRNGPFTKLYDRVQWAGTYTRMAGLSCSPSRGQYQITTEGKKLLATNITFISRKFLIDNYPSFKDFTLRHNNSTAITSEQQEIQHPSLQTQNTSPTDIIDDAFNEIQVSLIEELLQVIKKQTPQFFERLVVELLVKMGYGGSFEGSATVTQYVKDEGIDGIIKEDKLGLDKIYVQAKLWDKTPISRPEINKFVGALVGHGANKGVFITTATFTRDALEFKPMGSVKIVLIDGAQLCRYMIEYNLGVSVRQTYELKKIDTDYFEI